jgi:hypothetical protein
MVRPTNSPKTIPISEAVLCAEPRSNQTSHVLSSGARDHVARRRANHNVAPSYKAPWYPTAAPRERCSRFADADARVKATSIAPRKRNARAARKRNVALPDFIADCLCTSKNPSGRQSARWLEHQLTSVRDGHATRSKLCLRNSSSACDSGG